MKLVPGYMFKVNNKPVREFKSGVNYRIYHIAPTKDGVEYIFQSTSGNLKEMFKSTDEAEAIITKMAGNK